MQKVLNKATKKLKMSQRRKGGKEMEFRFDGINVLFNGIKTIDERVQVRISYLTALIYIDGEHITSYYPRNLVPETLAECLIDDIKDYNLQLSEEDIYEIAKYIISCVN